MKQKEITALMVEPGKHPRVTKLKDDLDSLQKAVSIGADYQGLIEFVSLRNGDCIMCNEEGKLIGLEGNRRFGDDILVGVFYIMSENEDGELVSLVFVIFCTPKSWWCIIVFTILFNVSLAGSNQNGTNITYNYVKDEYIVQAIAIKQSIVGVLGFGASLIGSKILEYVQQNGNTFMGMEVYGQQLLAGISLIFVIAAVVFNKAVVEKQKRMIQ